MSEHECPCCAAWKDERDRLKAEVDHMRPAYDLRCEINARQQAEIAHLKRELERVTTSGSPSGSGKAE